MGKDLKGKELGTGLRQRKDGRYEARAKINGIDINLYDVDLKKFTAEISDENLVYIFIEKLHRFTAV